MTHRTFQPKPTNELTYADLWNTRLPIEATWGIYARQSTPAQLVKNQESTEMQTDDLIQWLVDRGVNEGKIFLFDADLGKSGRLRIDQRTDLQELVEQIQKDLIKAVLVYQISRLFRDETGVQYNTFANICKQHNCLLVTSDAMIFNFSNPIHMKMFRYLAEMAAEFIPQHIGMLHAARLRKARKGLYAGLGVIPTGYIVDYRKDSLTYKKFIPYWPHARVVLWVFERYYALEGNMIVLCRELQTLPVLFPDFDAQVDQRNVTNTRRRKVPGGFHLSRTGVEFLLANPVYLGWWIVQGDIISDHNHEGIFDAEHEYLFWYAFNRLAPYTTKGEINVKRIVKGTKRFYQTDTTAQKGLLKDKITSPHGATYVHIVAGSHRYNIIPQTSTSLVRIGQTAIEAGVIDDAFTAQFFKRLQETRDFDVYRQWLADEQQKRTALAGNIKTQLQQIDIQQEAILSEILAIRTQFSQQVQQAVREDASTDTEQLRKRLEDEAQAELQRLRKRLNSLEAPKAELTKKQDELAQNQAMQKAQEFADFQTELAKLIVAWDKKPFQAKCEFVNLFVEKATVTIVAAHWLQLEIVWSHPQWGIDTLFIHRKRGATPFWTEEEHEIIKTHFSHMPREALLALLPDRCWASVRDEALNLGVERTVRTVSDIPQHHTWSDWQFIQEMGIAPDDQTTKCLSASRPTE